MCINAWTPTCRILALKKEHLFLRKPDNIYKVHSLWDRCTRKTQVMWSPRRKKCQEKPRTQMCGWKSGLGSGSSCPNHPSWNHMKQMNSQAKQVQFSSVIQSCLTLCDPIDCSMPGFPSQAKPFPNSVMGKPMRSSIIFNKLFTPQHIWWQNLEPFLGY